MNAPRATVTGSLAKTPIPDLLVYALDHNWKGTLVVEEPDGGKSAVLFEAGAPAKAKTFEPISSLAQVLVGQGVISEEVSRRALSRMAQERKLFGEVLLADKAVDHQRLADGLREQVTQKVIWLFTRPGECVYGYYQGTDFLARWGGRPTRVKPLPLLWRGLRQHADPQRVSALVARLGETPLKLFFDAPIGRFKLDPHERGVVDVLRGKPRSVEYLLGCGLGEEALVKRVVYSMLLTRQIDLGVPGTEPVGLDEAPSSTRLSTLPTGRFTAPKFSSEPAEGLSGTHRPAANGVGSRPASFSTRRGR